MPVILRSVLWIGFYCTIIVAWWVMFRMARMSGVDVIGHSVGMNMMPMHHFGPVFMMWAIMMAAMMLPTLVPTLLSYEDLIQSANGTRSGWLGVLIGYFIVWIGFAALISSVQIGLTASGAISSLGAATSSWLAGGLLILVGIYQFTRVKELCHGVCLSPMSYFLGRWRIGTFGGIRMGLGLGVFCVGCCWGFMVLGFVGGVMSLLWMGLATLIMAIEKLPDVGRFVTRPLGVVFTLAGICVAMFGVKV